jgi:sulfatase maturation enzyme AslB (radical SAM superfamily)
MTLTEWFNSPPVRDFRKEMFKETGTSICNRCYYEADHSGTSRRHRSNQKSVIFTKQAFADSFEQSPGYNHFEFSNNSDGLTTTQPIDLHIDLGNHCNLACKMCDPRASTRIATQYVKWGMPAEQYLGVDWTKDQTVWHKFLAEIVTIPKLKNIHFMGGETLLSPRLEELVDYMIEHGRFDVSFSFVTNGTVYNPELIEKLKQFPRVGIELSIETTTEHNDYIRQGSKIIDIIKNIKLYKQHCNNTSVSLTIRTAISALSIGYYHTLLKFCLEEQLIIKSLIVDTPAFLNPNILPQSIKQEYSKIYYEMLNELSEVDTSIDYNESDPNQYRLSVKQQVEQIISILNVPHQPQQSYVSQMIAWCEKWDKEFNFDLISLYPEFKKLYEDI